MCILAATLTVAAASAAAQRAASTVVAGQTTITLPDSSKYSAVAKKILQLEIDRSAAIARHDTKWLADLYAPDFQGIPAGGRRVDRAALLQIFTGDAPDTKFLIDELTIRDFGSSAMVMGRLRSTTVAGAPLGESRYLHMYLLRDGHWWIVAAAGSIVQQPSSPR